MKRKMLWAAVFWAWTNLLFGTHSVTAYAQAAAAVAEPTAPASYQAVIDAFMSAETENINPLIREAQRDARQLSLEQRKLLIKIRQASRRMPPPWWDRTKSTSNISFKADMWGRAFEANFMPSEMLGMQAPIGVRGNRLLIVVTWRPGFVDNPRELDGWLAEKHGLTEGDLGEVIVWHELGHNYISLNLTLRQAMELYTQHRILFSHVQEFYADLTALRHCSPPAARTALMFRLRELSDYDERSAHTRAAHGLGALLLSEWLENPDDWPMVHFPPAVPAANAELETIKYIYEHFDPTWSAREYFALQDFIDRWAGRHGDRVLRGRGQMRLANDQVMMLTEPDDRDLQPKRDEWVAAKLRQIIDDGRADPLELAKTAAEAETDSWTGIEISW